MVFSICIDRNNRWIFNYLAVYILFKAKQFNRNVSLVFVGYVSLVIQKAKNYEWGQAIQHEPYAAEFVESEAWEGEHAV